MSHESSNGRWHRRYSTSIILTVAGALVGYFVFHPYAMLVHALSEAGDAAGPHYDLPHVISSFHSSLSSFMVSGMAASFAVFGGIVGSLTGTLLQKRKKLFDAQLETAKRRMALETLRRLMVTMSHHLLNANTVIGCMVRKAQRHAHDGEVLTPLLAIRDEARRIDAVIEALRELTEITTSDYSTSGKDLLIDISRAIEKALADSRQGQ
ncbi:MAG: hypothetical protein ACM34H_06695 [Deltaproteobacteria bacterium]